MQSMTLLGSVLQAPRASVVWRVCMGHCGFELSFVQAMRDVRTPNHFDTKDASYRRHHDAWQPITVHPHHEPTQKQSSVAIPYVCLSRVASYRERLFQTRKQQEHGRGWTRNVQTYLSCAEMGNQSEDNTENTPRKNGEKQSQ